MNLTAITFRKENTCVANVTIKKNMVKLNDLFTTKSAYQYILSGNSMFLCEFLLTVLEKTSQKSNVIFSIPGSLVNICCAENTMSKRKFNDEEQRKKTEKDWISELLIINEPDQYYFSTFPTQKNGKHITAMSIFKGYVNTILEACGDANIDISNISIEPEVLPALRIINEWETACCFLEVEEDDAKLTVYDPHKGMLSMALLEASWNSLSGSNGTENLSKALAMYEITADNTFGYKVDNLPPIYLLSEYDAKLYELLTAGEYAIRFKSFKIPQIFQDSRFSSNDLIKYASTLGLSQRPLFCKQVNNN